MDRRELLELEREHILFKMQHIPLLEPGDEELQALMRIQCMDRYLEVERELAQRPQ